MSSPNYGLSATGFLKKPLEVVKNDLETGLQAEFGNINTDPESVFGQLIGSASKSLEDLWETLEAVYQSQYPGSAEGVALDNVAALLGISRLQATATRVYATVSGVENTVIPQGSIAVQQDTSYNFVSVAPAIISRANANYVLLTASNGTIGDNYQVTINGIVYSRPLLTTIEALIDNLVADIGNNTVNAYYATKVNASSFTIRSFNTDNAFNLSSSSNLVVSNVRTPVLFQATETGPIVVPVGTLNQTVTSILGWNAITNEKPGVTGRNIETDAELRLRRARSFILGGYATVEAIRSHLLQEVPGVLNVDIIENRTMKQSDLTFTTTSNFVPNDKVNVFMDGLFVGQVLYNNYNDQQATMQAVANLIQTVAGVQSATVSNSPYRAITVVFIPGYDVLDNDIQIERGLTPTFTSFAQVGGRPAKSFETIVEGGDDQSVADNIWKTKPAGIETFGNTFKIVIDSMGNQQPIYFTRAENVNIWVNVTVTLSNEEPLAGGSQAAATQFIKNNIMEYAATLGIGDNVINQRVMCKVIDVSGIDSAVITMAARTDNIAPAPGEYVSGNITIGDSQIAVFDPNHIQVNFPI